MHKIGKVNIGTDKLFKQFARCLGEREQNSVADTLIHGYEYSAYIYYLFDILCVLLLLLLLYRHTKGEHKPKAHTCFFLLPFFSTISFVGHMTQSENIRTCLIT